MIDTLKRSVFCLGWAIGIYLSITFAAGLMIGISSAIQYPDSIYAVSYQRGQAMGMVFGWIILLMSIFLAISLSVGGRLPGTRPRDQSTVEPSDPVAPA